MKLRSLSPLSSSRSLASNDEWPSIFTLHREVGRLFDDLVRGGSGGKFVTPAQSSQWSPRLNIAETDKDFQITVDLPGVAEKDVELAVNDGLLSIKGTRHSEKEDSGKNYHRVESFFGSFERSVSLPDSIAFDKIDATFKNGLLTVTLPKDDSAKNKTKKIAIRAN